MKKGGEYFKTKNGWAYGEKMDRDPKGLIKSMLLYIIFLILLFFTYNASAHQEGVTSKKYVATFHSFWLETCKLTKGKENDTGKLIDKLQKVSGVPICNYIYSCSKIRYTRFATECYKENVKLFDCLEKSNFFKKCFQVE